MLAVFSFFRCGQRLNYCSEFDDFQVWRALNPVVTPAYNKIAPIRRMAVVPEVSALELEFDSHPLPLARIDLPLRLAIRETCLNGLNVIPQFASDYSKQEYDALFVDRFVAEAAEVDWISVCWAIVELGVPVG